MTLTVRLTGYADGADPAAARAALMKTFGLSPDKADALLGALPRAVKAGLDEAGAARFRAALEAMGFTVDLLGAAAPASAPAPAAPGPGAPVVPAAPPPRAPASSHAEQPGFAYRIEGAPDFAFLTIRVPANQTIKVEASAMATMDTHMRMKTKMGGGFGRLLTGESIFINEYTAEKATGEIGIAPGAPGDIGHVFLENGAVIYLQSGAFVASDTDITLESKWQGFTKGFFSGESFFLIRASGTGDLWFNTYGGLIAQPVDGEYVVDTGHIVAFTDGLEYSVGKFGGYKSLFFSGEGFVCRFRGKGTVWIQTRSANALLAWTHPFRPAKGG